MFKSIWLTLSFFIFIGVTAKAEVDPIKLMPVQDGGRLKPYDSFARESLQMLYGKQSFNGKAAVEIITTIMIAPDLWANKEFLKVDHKGLKQALKLDEEKSLFSPETLLTQNRTDLVFRELQSMRQNNEKLTPYFQAVQRLESQLVIFHNLRLGGLRVAPPKEGDTWLAIKDMSEDLQQKFILMTKAFALNLGQSESSNKNPQIFSDYEKATRTFMEAARAENPSLYPSEKHLEREVFFNTLHPFQWAWILYLVALILAVCAWQTQWKVFRLPGWIFVFLGLAFHIYGFVVRSVLTGRPPVSNMYETVTWVAFGCVFFAIIFEWKRKKFDVLACGAAVATLCLLVADSAPVILDSSLQPLEPVLRSNLWLTVHVLTITLSYAPLFLAFAIGAVGLFYFIRGESENSERVRSLTHASYRSIQIGVVLLAAGTILGGVWADYSWGRFWGWDPKETWAFIALMGYLAILHGRLTGWVKNFGMLAGSVVSFNLVIMAWYGVNFVLGAGLHSYGFGAGGIEYVAGFCGFFLIFTIYAAHVRFLRPAKK